MSSSSPFWGWERERVKALSFKKPWICLEKKNRPSTKLHNDSSLFNDALKTWNPKLPKLLCIQWLILDVLRLKGYTVCANNVSLTKKRKTIAGLPFLPQDILPSRKRVELPNWLQWQNNFSFIGFDDETCRNCSFSKPDGTGFFFRTSLTCFSLKTVDHGWSIPGGAISQGCRSFQAFSKRIGLGTAFELDAGPASSLTIGGTIYNVWWKQAKPPPSEQSEKIWKDEHKKNSVPVLQV